MKKVRNIKKKYLLGLIAAVCVCLFLVVLFKIGFGSSDDEEMSEILMDEAVLDFYKTGSMPCFKRQLPLAEDDPLVLQGVSEESEIPYHYGLVYENINDEYYYDEESGTWEGNEPAADSGLLIGGNAVSFETTGAGDKDRNDFAAILPYASLGLNGDNISLDKGTIEYSFGSECFNRNEFETYERKNVSVVGEEKTLTHYKRMTDDVQYSVVTGEPCLQNVSGILYSGGIRKTVLDPDGNYTETVVKNENGEPLFTVRFKDAVLGRKKESFDLVLRFSRITFVAEEEVTGPFSIMEGNALCISPLLYENGEYLVGTREEGEDGQQGIRIGARYEFDYSIESEDGETVEGLLYYNVSNLDEPSMAPYLETDADWGTNSEGNDYKWAEGVGIADGAASYAVRPYYNHSLADADGRSLTDSIGDSSLLHVSRMEGIQADGTANGLMFSASSTASGPVGGSDNDHAFDTGFAVLLKPQGSMVVTMSADRKQSTQVLVFPFKNGCKMVQNADSGGRIYSLCNSSERGVVKNDNYCTVLAYGSRYEFIVDPDPGFSLLTLTIDQEYIPVYKIRWIRQTGDDGTVLYRSEDSYEGVYLIRDESGAVHIDFGQVNSSHTVSANFVLTIWKIPAQLNIAFKNRTKILFAALFCAFVFLLDVLWMLVKKPSGNTVQ